MRKWLIILVALGSPNTLSAESSGFVASRLLPLGTVISAEDLRPAERDVGGSVKDAEQAIGQEVRRTVFAGRPILVGDLRTVSLVRRNDVVSLRFVTGGLSIRTEGRALDRGSAGESISVMNLTSRTVVRGVVSGPGQVEVAQ